MKMLQSKLKMEEDNKECEELSVLYVSFQLK